MIFIMGTSIVRQHLYINTLRLRQNGRHFPDDIFKCVFLNENEWIQIKISLKFVPKGQINNIPSLLQKMAWRQPGDKPLPEVMMVSILMHICVTRPQWVKMVQKFSICHNSCTMECTKKHCCDIEANLIQRCHLALMKCPRFPLIHWSDWCSCPQESFFLLWVAVGNLISSM